MRYKKLDQDYSYKVDTLGEEDWTDIIVQFRDASLYQTWSYGKERWGEECMSHLVLWKKNVLIAATLVRIVKVPVFGHFIAYLFHGPMWKKKGGKEIPEVLMHMLGAIINEYAFKRKLFIKIIPSEYRHSDTKIHRIYKEAGFSKDRSAYERKTYLIDITPPVEELHKGLSKKWRENLRRSQRGLLEVYEGTSSDLYDRFIEL
jgi:lipid II:glycine glycyltransferase (peptidoglycan interpeptide bridge formation enzyme)